LACQVLLRHVRNQVHDSARVAPLVVVPSNELDELSTEGNTGLSIEDAGVVITDKVSRDNLLIGVRENAFEGTIGSSLVRSLDLVVGGLPGGKSQILVLCVSKRDD